MDQESACKSCDRGTMVRTKVRRMNGFVVFLGFVLLIPSFLGVGIGAISLAGSSFIAAEAGKTPEQVESDLEAAKVPEALIERVMAGEPITREEIGALNQEQQLALHKAQIAAVGKELPAGAAVGFSVAIIVASLVGGLLGFLLIRKRWVLRCTSCSAVVPAS